MNNPGAVALNVFLSIFTISFTIYLAISGVSWWSFMLLPCIGFLAFAYIYSKVEIPEDYD